MDIKPRVTVRGNVGGTPALQVSERGTKFARFRIAFTPRVKDSLTGQWHDGRTEWFTVKAFDDLAENVAASLVKGTPVVVQGVLSTSTWMRDGQEQTTIVINADVVGIDLRTGTAHFARVVRGVRLEEEEVAFAGSTPDSASDSAPDADIPSWEIPPADDDAPAPDLGEEPTEVALAGATTS